MSTSVWILLGIILVGLVWLFWPGRGRFWQWRHVWQTRERVFIEDALKHLHDREYHQQTATIESLAGVLEMPISQVNELVGEMQRRQLLVFSERRLQLTAAGREYARRVIRAHRLWERYLADQTGYAEAEWHSQAERREHELTPAQADALSGDLGHPRYDPHGDPIPTAEGEIVAMKHQALSDLPPGQAGRIVHLEDEPEIVYAQLVAEGLQLGVTVRVIESTPQRLVLWANGDEHVLAPLVAANISVVPVSMADEDEVADSYESLTSLKTGETGRVVSLSQSCRGAERRRLMDLGILPGTLIKAELVSPSGDPTAYLIRGALIGLRREQASRIKVTRELDVESSQPMKHVKEVV